MRKNNSKLNIMKNLRASWFSFWRLKIWKCSISLARLGKCLKVSVTFEQLMQATDWFWPWSSYNGNTFIKWRLEILQMDKNYCLSTPLHCIPKISFISTASNSAISAISTQPVVYPKFIAFSTTTESKGIWVINFYVKF